MTVNGLATIDDAQRVAYFQRALASLAECMRDGVDVRGYVC
ncbi:MAG: family 1 glycosylhydrolase [Chloroflexi bacterium]|nr:family 1 glycosylhydrolase [Chloroflexota bacterium]